MKKKLFLLAILLTFSCAYFNTFYNARRYYKRAYHETKKNRSGKPTAAERTNYNKAIEKASRLVDFYSKSKYVDDALLMLGKCYYYQQDYLMARRKLMELKDNYPESGLIVEANIWFAKTNLALNLIDEAEVELNTLLNQKIPKKLKGEVYFYLGRLREEKNDFEGAIQAYLMAVDTGVDDLKSEALFNIGTTYDTLGMYDRAAEFFERVLKIDPLPEVRFEAEFKYGQMQKKQKNIDDAIRLFEELLGDERNQKRYADLRLEVADCLALKEDIDGAVIAYHDITQDYKKSKQSAMAYYRLGKIYEEYRRDYDRALDQFSKVRTEFRQSEVADSAETKKRDILRLQALRQVIDMVRRGEEGELVLASEETQEDTLTDEKIYAMIDSTFNDSTRTRLLLRMGGEAFVDSVKAEHPSEDQIRDPEDRRRSFRNRSTQLRTEEEDLERMDWNLWIEEGKIERDLNLVQELRNLKKRLERKERARIAENPELKAFRAEELDKNLFLLAELYLFRFFIPDSAVSQYRRLLIEFPESPYTPQALYNLGYVSSEIFGDSEGANTYYRRLMEDYPQSRFSNAVREKLGLPSASTVEDSVKKLFEDAETILFDKQDPVTAFDAYGRIVEEFPDSKLVPKALYSMAWVSETQLDSMDLAFVLYDSLVKHYSESVYAEKVKKKVDAVTREEQKKGTQEVKSESPGDSARVSQIQTVETSDEDKGKAEVKAEAGIELETEEKEREPKLPADSTGVREAREKPLDESEEMEVLPMGGMRAIQRKIVLPKGVDREKLAEHITFRIQLDEKGKVLVAELAESSNDTTLDASVLRVVKQTRFRLLLEEEESDSSWFRLSIPLDKKALVDLEK